MKLIALAVALVLIAPPFARAHAAPASCAPSVGPGIPPPPTVPSGIAGFHAAWYGQSGYPVLCPGGRASAVIAFYNSGTRGWVAGRPGETAFLGTWGPVPGQDRPSLLGGDGTNGGPATGWPSYDRIAAQPVPYVGPGEIAWFQFTIQAPRSPGIYLLHLRPLIEGTIWMEDPGLAWRVTVQGSDADTLGTIEIAGPALVLSAGATRKYTLRVDPALLWTCLDLAFVDASASPAGGALRGNGKVALSERAVFNTVGTSPANASFVRCAPLPPSGALEITITSLYGNAFVRPILFADINGDDALDLDDAGQPLEPVGVGAPTRFVLPMNGAPPDL
jgi:hypothetical protein